MAALLPDLADSPVQRQTMVDCQVRTFGVTDQRLLGRLLAVPRERFLPEGIRQLAYSDIGFSLSGEADGQDDRYLLPPLILARLVQGARVRTTDKVLDVACGTGYSTAILAGLAGEVVAVEAGPTLCRDLQARFAAMGLDRLRVVHGPLDEGAATDGPFDVILGNGAIETNPDRLFAQLADGGRLVTIRRGANDPTGRAAKAVCYEKRGGEVGMRPLFDASAPVLRAFRKESAFVF